MTIDETYAGKECVSLWFPSCLPQSDFFSSFFMKMMCAIWVTIAIFLTPMRYNDDDENIFDVVDLFV